MTLLLPFGTLLVTSGCAVIFLMQQFFRIPFSAVCLEPGLQMPQNAYRILTAPFFHLNWVHILSNMSVFLDVGPALERRFGSLLFICLILFMTVASGIMHEALAWTFLSLMNNQLWTKGAEQPRWMLSLATISRGCSVGFSGVLFALLVIRVYEIPASEVIWILDTVPCPARLYPVVLLILLQLLLPAVSFFGHLGGLLCGYSYARGWFWPWLFRVIPGQLIQSMDEKLSLWIPNWAKQPEGALFGGPYPNERDTGTIALALQNFIERWADSIHARFNTLHARAGSLYSNGTRSNRFHELYSNSTESSNHRSRDVVIYTDNNEDDSQTEMEVLVRAGYDPIEVTEALAIGEGDTATARLLIDTRLSAQLREMGFDSIDIENALSSGCPKNVTAIVDWINSLTN
ncbi:hypothetical protein CCYA_CCYA20G4793 [Cyanidiococcus yangmingshanensis]|nr:hypothetical protein CCYA_CCYA20G4793 [Cyanidiococcus yangmingshanensis]